MNKNCRFDNDDIIARYQLGILEESEEREVREHLETCEVCRQTLSELEAIADGLKLTGLEELPKSFKADLHDRLIEEQKILYSNSETEPKKTAVVILKELFPLRRFVPLAAMLAVVLLLTGKFGGLNFINTDTETETQEDSESIVVKHIDTDTAQEFKPYAVAENSTKQADNDTSAESAGMDNSDTENSDTENSDTGAASEKVEKIPQNSSGADNSDDITVAMEDSKAVDENKERKSDNSVTEENAESDNVKTDATGERMLTAPKDTVEAVPAPAEYSKEIAEDSINDEIRTGSSGKASGGGSPLGESGGAAGGGSSGGGGGAASMPTLESAVTGGAAADNSPQVASLDIYINVYKIDSSVIENSEYMNRVVTNDNGEKALYLSNSEYDRLCEEFGAMPTFKETRVVSEAEGYDVIVVVE